MNPLSALGRLMRGLPSSQPGQAEIPAAVEFDPAMQSSYTTEVGRSFDAYQSCYEQVAWVYMAVSAKAENASQVPLIVRHKGTKEEFPNHLLSQLLKCPNPWETGASFRQLTMIYLELTGNAYYEKVRDQFGLPARLFHLDSARTSPVPDPVIKVKGYEHRRLSGETTIVPSDKVIHFKYPDPNNSFLGIGRIAAARMGVTLDILTEKYNKAFFDNNATPAALLIPEEPLSLPLLNRVRNMLRREFQGVTHQHGIGVIGANMKLEKIGISPKDIEFLAQQQFSRDKIGSMFKVPPIYMGNFSEASYANADAQRKLFWEVCVLPWLMWWLDHINLFLVPIIDPEVEVIPDRAVVMRLMESLPTLTKALLDLRNSGFISNNEGREWLGLPQLEGEEHDTLFIPGQFRPAKVQMTDKPGPEAQGDPNNPANTPPASEPGTAPDEPTNSIERALALMNGSGNRVRKLLNEKTTSD